MARWFRSEPMEYISLIVNEDAAHDCLDDLGKIGAVQFTDLNPELTPFQRRYVTYVKKCDELERTLRYFSSEIKRFELELTSAGDLDEFVNSPASMVASGTSSDRGPQKRGAQVIESLEMELRGHESILRELNSYSQRLISEYNEKVELQEVLEKARSFFIMDAAKFSSSRRGGRRRARDSVEDVASNEEWLLSIQSDATPRTDLDLCFSSITGVVSTEEKARFERMIFRATRGNCYVRFASIQQPITDPESGALVEKSVFIIFYKSKSIELKVKKICDAFSAHRYSLPDMGDSSSVDKALMENAQELIDSRIVLLKNQDTRYRLCLLLAQHTERWTWLVLREKAVYHTLNMFKADVSGMLRGEGWVVAESCDAVREAVNRAHSSMCMTMPSLVHYVPQPWPTPPTHFETNKFTYGYQLMVSTYGIPRYREANPALFTAATFPFLFGVMYGDIGHGLFLFFLGLALLGNERTNENAKLGEVAWGVHTGRYMIASMGFFAIYAGLIYNDCFALGLNLFGTRYAFEGEHSGAVEDGDVAEQIAQYGSDKSVYPFGLDPIWHVSSNELLFFNSFKMKLSVIFGILQMFCGILLRGSNYIYFDDKLGLWYEFLPMFMFAASMFLYMVFIIFYKWSINWKSRMLSATCIDPGSSSWGSVEYDGEWVECDTNAGDGTCTPWGYSCTGSEDTATKCPLNYGGSGDGCQPPNLISTLINIGLNPGVVDEPLYSGQDQIQVILLILALVSIPVLLCVKPYFLVRESRTVVRHHIDEDNGDKDRHEDGDQGFSEIFIHQAIETIEFVLGMVSNTASYLRLWALSLAHSELATVFWDKAMLTTLRIHWFSAYIGFGVFAAITLGVLLIMDVLECFLHTLRLHWVEFQSKFFNADGVQFHPYSFKQFIKDASH